MSLLGLAPDSYPLIYQCLNQIDLYALQRTHRFFWKESRLVFLLREIYRFLKRKADVYALSTRVIWGNKIQTIFFNESALVFEPRNRKKMTLEFYQTYGLAPGFLPGNGDYLTSRIYHSSDNQFIINQLQKDGIQNYDLVILGNYRIEVYHNGEIFGGEVVENFILTHLSEIPPHYHHYPDNEKRLFKFLFYFKSEDYHNTTFEVNYVFDKKTNLGCKIRYRLCSALRISK